MTAPLGSVLIPAHNEAAVIVRCLDALFAGPSPGNLEVVVACNGCSDGTAQLARSSRHDVTVLELEQASKPAALRAGERALTSFPRLYLDADVVLSGDSALRVLDRLRPGEALAARPPISYDTAGSSSAIRHYYAARQRMPVVMNSLWGAGVYGLSEEGRRRFADYPDVIAEDLFVDQQFAEHELEIVECEPVRVRAPRRTTDLLRILRRSYRGNAQMSARPGGCGGRTRTMTTAHEVLRLGRGGPARAGDALVYGALATTGRLMTRFGETGQWERDESSRVA